MLWKIVRWANILNITYWSVICVVLTAASAYNLYNGGQVHFVQKVLSQQNEEFYVLRNSTCYFILAHSDEEGFVDYNGGAYSRDLVVRDLILKGIIPEQSQVVFVCCHPGVTGEFAIGEANAKMCGTWKSPTVATYLFFLLTYGPYDV